MERITPRSVDEVRALMAQASRDGVHVVPVGGGTHRRSASAPGTRLLSTAGLTDVVQHVPAELTATVQAGVAVDDLSDLLEGAGQWWPQADRLPGATVGGVVAAAASSRHRLRHGPVRDSLLEVVLVTGDGRLVKGGGPTVKSVAGYDIPRLMTGSFGRLGVIVQVTIKLTPLPPFSEWFVLEAPPAERDAAARRIARDVFRVGAILLTPRGLWVRLAGPSADVVAPDGMTVAVAPHEPAAATMVHIGVPPAQLGRLVGALDDRGADYIAEYGTGVCDVAVPPGVSAAPVADLGPALGGHATVTVDRGAPTVHSAPRDPALALIDDRLHHVFDPRGVLRPPAFQESAR